MPSKNLRAERLLKQPQGVILPEVGERCEADPFYTVIDSGGGFNEEKGIDS
jgi:hypothetical protein